MHRVGIYGAMIAGFAALILGLAEAMPFIDVPLKYSVATMLICTGFTGCLVAGFIVDMLQEKKRW